MRALLILAFSWEKCPLCGQRRYGTAGQLPHIDRGMTLRPSVKCLSMSGAMTVRTSKPLVNDSQTKKQTTSGDRKCFWSRASRGCDDLVLRMPLTAVSAQPRSRGLRRPTHRVQRRLGHAGRVSRLEGEFQGLGNDQCTGWQAGKKSQANLDPFQAAPPTAMPQHEQNTPKKHVKWRDPSVKHPKDNSEHVWLYAVVME